MIKIDGKKLSKKILEDIKKEIKLLDFKPVFSDILVGNDFASEKYVKTKEQMAEYLGISFHKAFFPEIIKTKELVEEIKKINNIKNICGIIVQLPLPIHLDQKIILDTIDPNLDVDVLGSVMSQKFYNGENVLKLPTALACIYILDSLNLDLKEKNIIVLGYGELVGKPVFSLLSQRGLEPIMLRSKTENKEGLLKNADIIISGIGKGNFIKGDMIKKGVILIDAGTSESGGGLVGDVDFDSVKNIASYLSPVPGGVGPLTIAMLFKNVLEVAKGISRSKDSGEERKYE